MVKGNSPLSIKTLSAGKQILVVSFLRPFCAQYWCADYYTDLLASSGSSIESAVDFGEFFTTFTNSLTISTLGAALTVICAFTVGMAAVRYRSKLTIWFDRIPYLLHAVPGLVIALSLVFFTINYAYSLYQTLPWLSSPTLCFIFQWHKPPCVVRLNKCLATLKK